MKISSKPIQSTPTLSGKDARVIIKEALTVPSKESIFVNESKLSDSKKIFK